MIAQRVSAGTGADLEQAISAMRQESFQRHSFRAVLVGTIFGIPEPRLVVRAFVVTDWNRVVARRHRMSVSPRAYVLLEDCTPMGGADFGRLSCIRCKHFGGSRRCGGVERSAIPRSASLRSSGGASPHPLLGSACQRAGRASAPPLHLIVPGLPGPPTAMRRSVGSARVAHPRSSA